MAEQLREGTYSRFGASRLADGICFTFEGEKDSDCAIRLYEKGTEKDMPCIYRDIPVPKEFCIGAVRSVCIPGLDPQHYDYNYVIGDHCLELSRTDMVLYKLHVRGFTKDGGVTGRNKGTFAAVTEKIPYLKELGITTVELMPAYEFEELVPPRHEDHPMNFEGWAPQAVAGYQLMQQKEYEEKEKELPGINWLTGESELHCGGAALLGAGISRGRLSFALFKNSGGECSP